MLLAVWGTAEIFVAQSGSLKNMSVRHPTPSSSSAYTYMSYNNLCCSTRLRHAIFVCQNFGSSLIAFRALALAARLQCCSTCRSVTVLYSTCNFAMAVCRTYSYCMIEVAPDYLNTIWTSEGQIKYTSRQDTRLIGTGASRKLRFPTTAAAT